MKKKKYENGGDPLLGLASQIPGIMSAFGSNSASSKAAAVGSTIGAASNLIVPGLGSVLSPILGSLGGMLGKKDDQTSAMQDHYNGISTNLNPFQIKANGGILGTEDNFQYIGNTHKAGGINVGLAGLPSMNGIAEVEDKEASVEILNDMGKRIRYIFSNKLKI